MRAIRGNREHAQRLFLAWAKKRMPQAYADVMNRHGRGAGLGEAAATDTTAAQPAGILDTLVNNIGKIGTAYAQYQSQKSLINLNMERAKQGLPPIDAGDVAPQANVGIAPATRNMLYVGIGALVLIGAMMAFGRRR